MDAYNLSPPLETRYLSHLFSSHRLDINWGHCAQLKKATLVPNRSPICFIDFPTPQLQHRLQQRIRATARFCRGMHPEALIRAS